MAKINRRRLLLSGLTAGVTGGAIAQAVQAQPSQRLPNPPRLPIPGNDIEAIFGGGNPSTPAGQPNQPDPSLTPPTIPYDRGMSKLLIRCSHLGLRQFEQGQQDSRYNGAIQGLEGYTPDLDRYTQVATFTASLDATTTLLPNLGDVGNRILRRLVTPRRVFIGFALTSEANNIIVFRGTSNPLEWIANFQARQSNYGQSGGVRGRVHTGFLRLYDQLAVQVRTVTDRFNPKVPCFITGHSLGGALATLATADLVQRNRALQDRLQLYSYAAPRVGDLEFVRSLSTIAPNSFRVINFADIVPMVPPSRFRDEQYFHVGQKWGFLDYGLGDVVASHTTTLYQLAIDKQVESSEIPAFPSMCR